MVAIKGMKMPKSCSECPFKANDYVCGLLDCAFSCNHFKERNYNCPLVEIVTCNDCKYCYPDEDGRGYHCERDSNVRFSVCDNFYCAGRERRE